MNGKYGPCSICEEYIEGVICDKENKCPVGKMKKENEDLFYKLSGVMLSVDKWLEGDELNQDEVQRAATMREKTLQITEEQQAEIENLKHNLKCVKDHREELIERHKLQREEIERYKGVIKLLEKDVATAKPEAVKEFAKRLKEMMFNYYECVGESAKGKPYKGDTLMDYEVVNMIDDCIDNLVKEVTENEGKE